MTHAEATDKVVRLLKLAKSDNPNEAALAAAEWIKKNLKTHTKTTYSRHDSSAREAGRKAGNEINVNASRGGLGSGQRYLP